MILGRVIQVLSLAIYSINMPNVAHAQWYNDAQQSMGTEAGVMIWHENLDVSKDLAGEVFSLFQHFDATYSSYRPDSDLNHVNQHAAQAPVQVKDEFFNLLKTSVHFSELSGGLFDITYHAVGQQYDYRQQVMPEPGALFRALKLVNYRGLVLDKQNNTVAFEQAGMSIDFGGIGKGFVVDKAIFLLAKAGVTQAMVYAGGDSRYLGQKEDRPWMVGIRHPRSTEEQALVLPLDNIAVSTSGDYERYFISPTGERHHHIINPATGQSPREVVSATVLGPKATTTDALSTTLLIAGISDALALVEKMDDIDAILIDAQGKVHFSSGLNEPGEQQ